MDFRVGAWLVQPGLCKLVGDGHTSHVTPKAMDVLVCLARRPGQVVSKEEIRQTVWPDTYVSDDSLTRCIVELRRAFQDDARQPGIIETIAKRGYRVIPQVTWEEIQPPTQIVVRGRHWWAAGTVAVVVVAGCAIWLTHRPSAGRGAVPVPAPLTSYPGLVMGPSFSPDGQRVAFGWQRSGADKFHIYVKQIGAEQPIRLTGEATDDRTPAWSPDGRWIAFRRQVSGERSSICLIPSIGGLERKLCEGPGFWSRIAWHPAGGWIAVPDRSSEKEPYALFLVSAETGEKRRLTTPPPKSRGDFDPAFSPDGRRLAFTRSASTTAAELQLLEISQEPRAAGEPRRIQLDQPYAREPVWYSDGSALLFSAGQTLLRRGLWEIKLRGLLQSGEPHRLPFVSEGQFFQPDISRDGRIVFVQNRLTARIRRVELEGSHADEEMPMNSRRIDHVPQYSPDGRRIALISDRSGTFEVWVCDADGSNLMKLTSFGGPYVGSVAWSPDGQRLSVQISQGEARGLYTVSVVGGRPTRLIELGSADELSSWSRDGRWIYIQSGQSGMQQVWKIPVDGGTAVQVTRQAGGYAVESPDGKSLYYEKGTANEGMTELWSVDVNGGAERRVIDDMAAQFFAVTGRGIYYFSGWESPEVRRYNFANRSVETVAQIRNVHVAWGLSISPDDKRLLYSAEGDLMSELMVVEGHRP